MSDNSQVTNSLQVLADNRDALLLAEVAAWLHMFGKFHEDFLNGNYKLDKKIPDDVEKIFPQLANLLEDSWTGNIWAALDASVPEMQAQGLTIHDLIINHRNQQASGGFLQLMFEAHGRGSNAEKGVLDDFAREQHMEVYLSTSVGNDLVPFIGLSTIESERKKLYPFIEEKLKYLKDRDAKLGESDWTTFRKDFLSSLRERFGKSVAETRRPLNDVTLDDQTFASVAFFKAALAQNILEGWIEPHIRDTDPNKKYQYCILRIGLSGLEYWGKSIRVGDILARRNLVMDALDNVRQLLEVVYPLGLEVYRDENGSAFIVPNIQNLLQLPAGSLTLGELIQEIASQTFSGESRFELSLSRPTRSALLFGQEIAKELVSPKPEVKWLQDQWKNVREDICPVCSLRPQGPGDKSLSRKVCDICEERREKRSKAWVRDKSKTVWIDEIADVNGRVGFIVAQFSLRDWLSGSAFNSILSIDFDHLNSITPKNSSNPLHFDWISLVKEINDVLLRPNSPLGSLDEARYPLFRNLVATNKQYKIMKSYEFYQSRIVSTDLEVMTQLTEPERLALEIFRLSPSFSRIFRVRETTQSFWESVVSDFEDADRVGKVPGRLQIEGTFTNGDSLGESHTYELKLGTTNLSIVCKNPQTYLTIDNLRWVAKLLGMSEDENKGATDEVKYQEAAKYLKQHLENGQFDVEEPTGYGGSNKPRGRLRITKVEFDDTPYTPAISILTEPRTFMALVPSDKAIKVVDAIKRKYEEEMGKVRNRLPMTIGVVFAGRRTPLPAILDAGRRMLKQPTEDNEWEVTNVDPPYPHSSWPSEVTLTLRKDGQDLSIQVSTVMGDSKTEDVWYPYWRLKDGTENLFSRDRKFKGINGRYWTHVCDLRIGDFVSFMPSHLDFEFLDTASRRFEISYEDGKRRGTVHPARPYYLEQLDDIEELWKILSNKEKGLATSQIDNLVGLIGAKRKEWLTDQDNPVFRQIVSDIVANAGWKGRLDEGDRKRLIQAAITGQLADVVELHMTILKEGGNDDYNS